MGNKSQDRAETADDTVYDQVCQERRRTDRFQAAGHGILDRHNEHIIGPVCHVGAESCHGNRIDNVHNHKEDRNTENTVRNDPVDLIGGTHLLLRFLYIFSDQSGDILISLIGDDGFRIVVHLFFQIRDHRIRFVLCGNRKFQFLQNLAVAFQHLDRIPPSLLLGNAGGKQIFHSADRRLYFRRKACFRLRRFLFRGFCNRCFYRFLYTRTFQRGGLYDRASQSFLQPLHIDLNPALIQEIRHIQGDHYRDAEFQHLRGKIQISLDVRRIHQIQDRIRMILHQIITADDFFQCIWGEGINTRKVCDNDILLPFPSSFFLFHGNARPVSDILICACQSIKHGSFSAVRVSCQRNFSCHNHLPLFLIPFQYNLHHFS